MIAPNSIHDQPTPTDPILDQLSDARIFTVHKVEDRFCITECCDYYFEALLSKDEMLKLIDELKELVK